MDMKEQQTQLFSSEDAQKLQPIMEDFMADCDAGNEKWLANRLEQALPEESRENRQQIMEEIETGVEKFNSILPPCKMLLPSAILKKSGWPKICDSP